MTEVPKWCNIVFTGQFKGQSCSARQKNGKVRRKDFVVFWSGFLRFLTGNHQEISSTFKELSVTFRQNKLICYLGPKMLIIWNKKTGCLFLLWKLSEKILQWKRALFNFFYNFIIKDSYFQFEYCGIIFISMGQGSWVAKIFLVRGDEFRR